MGRTRKKRCRQCHHAWWTRYWSDDYFDPHWVEILRGCRMPKKAGFRKQSAFVDGKCRDFEDRGYKAKRFD